jgi:hypothetical protein
VGWRACAQRLISARQRHTRGLMMSRATAESTVDALPRVACIVWHPSVQDILARYTGASIGLASLSIFRTIQAGAEILDRGRQSSKSESQLERERCNETCANL